MEKAEAVVGGGGGGGGEGEGEVLRREESSESCVSSLFGTEDNIRNNSSGDLSSISGNSSSSGEFPAVVIDEAAVVVRNPTPAPAVKEAGCVGRKNKSVTWGFTSVIGRRREMEDAVAVIPGFMSRTCDHVGGCTAPGSKVSGEITPVHYFGVFDGHGGSQVAKFCAERMHEVISEQWEKGEVNGKGWRHRWEEAFSSGFGRTDKEVSKKSIAPEIVGSTAVVVALSGCQIITSNCGDSRAILCRGKQTIQLSVDHKPDREDELARIEGGGGKVIYWNGARVLGVLAMSRSIGDHYMRPWIIPDPEVTFTTRTEEDECLIVASDGLWDVMSNDEVGETARHLFRRMRCSAMADETSPSPAQAVADHLTDVAFRKNSSDNISVVVVDLKMRKKRRVRQAK